MTTNKITPFLWFDANAEEAVDFYVSVFKDAEKKSVSRYGESVPDKAGTVLTVGFSLFGQDFTALNGGPIFKFNESVSFFVKCKDQQEIDYYWQVLTANGGQESQCGWLKDKFGLSWQIAPESIMDMVSSPDEAAKERMMNVMMQMQKLDVAKLEAAFKG